MISTLGLGFREISFCEAVAGGDTVGPSGGTLGPSVGLLGGAGRLGGAGLEGFGEALAALLTNGSKSLMAPLVVAVRGPPSLGIELTRTSWTVFTST